MVKLHSPISTGIRVIDLEPGQLGVIVKWGDDSHHGQQKTSRYKGRVVQWVPCDDNTLMQVGENGAYWSNCREEFSKPKHVNLRVHVLEPGTLLEV